MFRQRIRTSTSRVSTVTLILTVLLGLALIYYGAVLLLLAAGVSPTTLNAISGYRTAYDFLASLGPESFDTTTRLIVGVAGLLALLLFAYLAYKALPRPHLARRPITLSRDERGEVELEPRALERVAESAAAANPLVASASGRTGDDELTVLVAVRRPTEIPGTMRDVQRRVREALDRHDLPPTPVNVTLTGIDAKRRRELS